MSNEGHHFPCESCGANLRFHIGVQSLKCEFCGTVKTIDLEASKVVAEQDFRAMLQRVQELRTKNAAPITSSKREITCDNCGGTVEFIGTLTSDECAYCGTALQLENIHDAEDRVPVDGVLPFQVDRQQAQGQLAQWIKSRWFAPNEFRRRGVQGRFSGVYVPFWTFDALTHTHWSGQRGDHYTVTVGSGKNRRTETRTSWSYRSGQFQHFFDDVIIIAATNMPRKRLDALDPWPLDRCLPFNEAYLAGYLASTYDIELDAGFETARELMEEQLRGMVRGEIGGDEQRITEMNVHYDAITYKHVLLPIWSLVYRYHNKPYQVFINAGTGEVQGDRPWSWVKITLTLLFAFMIGLGGFFVCRQSRSSGNMIPTNLQFHIPQ